MKSTDNNNNTNNNSNSNREITNSDLEILQSAYEYTIQQRKKLLSQRNFVDLNIVYKGIEYYRFLNECLPPAAIPDVPFMSALLDLVIFLFPFLFK
jgi:hypothetical protein